jgi:hypothetical protein
LTVASLVGERAPPPHPPSPHIPHIPERSHMGIRRSPLLLHVACHGQHS